jgi:hypothetical protein
MPTPYVAIVIGSVGCSVCGAATRVGARKGEYDASEPRTARSL